MPRLIFFICVLIVLATFALGAGDWQAMKVCQMTNSFDTCYWSLNR